jgi:hypothetical protein
MGKELAFIDMRFKIAVTSTVNKVEVSLHHWNYLEIGLAAEEAPSLPGSFEFDRNSSDWDILQWE